jgi:hypothetical protein
MASIPVAFQRRQTPFDRSDDIDQLLQRVGSFRRKLALIADCLDRAFGVGCSASSFL